MKEIKLVSKPFPWMWLYSSDDCWYSGWSSRLLWQTTTCFRLLIGSPFFRTLIRFPILTTLSNYLNRLPAKIKYSEVTVMRIKITSRRHLPDLLLGEILRDILTLRFRIKHSRNSNNNKNWSLFFSLHTDHVPYEFWYSFLAQLYCNFCMVTRRQELITPRM
jgi:hypothetical protein